MSENFILFKKDFNNFLLDKNWQDFKVITTQFPIKSMYDLQLLKDQEWDQLEIPLNCKITLKEFIESLPRKSEYRKIKSEFSGEKKMFLYQFSEKIEFLVSLGYGRLKAFEALLLIKTEIFDQKSSIENAVSYLNMTEFDQKLKKKLKRNKDPVVKDKAKKAIKRDWPFDLIELETIELECIKLLWRKKLLKNLVESKKLKNEQNKRKSYVQILSYLAYLEGILSSSVYTKEIKAKIEKFRIDNGISLEMHIITLQTLGQTYKGLENRLANVSSAESTLCSICYEREKTHLIIGRENCFHFCFCESCSETIGAEPEPKCPVCCVAIAKIQRVLLE